MGEFGLLVELHREGSALQPAQQACMFPEHICTFKTKDNFDPQKEESAEEIPQAPL